MKIESQQVWFRVWVNGSILPGSKLTFDQAIKIRNRYAREGMLAQIKPEGVIEDEGR